MKGQVSIQYASSGIFSLLERFLSSKQKIEQHKLVRGQQLCNLEVHLGLLSYR